MHESTQPCSCDPGKPYTCDWHKHKAEVAGLTAEIARLNAKIEELEGFLESVQDADYNTDR